MFLPKPICNLQSLRSLNLDYNSLEYLPESIAQLKALQSLDLEYNKLRT
ncbi:MAG: leucine-rich repeat domain-containing protein, partial [Candidatus Lokiarchaeota archaeon]|nr:leucine-rich repeat domain-containing protein [Candidatus Lokiarchaeota archaeon]